MKGTWPANGHMTVLSHQGGITQCATSAIGGRQREINEFNQ